MERRNNSHKGKCRLIRQMGKTRQPRSLVAECCIRTVEIRVHLEELGDRRVKQSTNVYYIAQN
jgi:hypothetical protein